MNLRRASLADLSLLRSWEQRPHVRRVLGDDGPWDWEAALTCDGDWRELLIAEIDGRPIGFIQIMDPARDPEQYWGENAGGLRAVDIWIGEASDLRRGYGMQMMRLALARCFASPEVCAVLVDPLASNRRALSFYESLGFRCVERRSFGQDDCLVYRLDRRDWEAGVRRS